MLRKSQDRLLTFLRFTITVNNEFLEQRHMVNVPKRGSITNFVRKLSSDSINKIWISKSWIIRVFLEKKLEKDTKINLISH